MSSPDFDNQTLAVLRGRMVRYLMRSREVRPAQPSLLRRSSPHCNVCVWCLISHRALACVDPSPSPQVQLLPAPFPQITLGRATKDNQIDVDLSLEGPAWKISRKQGTSRKQ